MANVSDLKSKKVRLWMDGCFDMVHFGHAFQAFKTAKTFGDTLIIGVCSDEDILQHKGCKPVFSLKERVELIRELEYVDEVIPGVPMGTSLEILEKHNCEYCVHGSDTTLDTNGQCYYERDGIKPAGKYKEFEIHYKPISTTEIIDRILRVINEEHLPTGTSQGALERFDNNHNADFFRDTFVLGQDITNIEKRTAFPTAKIVYTSGLFDICCHEHMLFLKQAATQGDYLIVGILDRSDKEPNNLRPPIMNIYERAMNIAKFRFVDKVIVSAPTTPTAEFLRQNNIDMVVMGANDPVTIDMAPMISIHQFEHDERKASEDIVQRIAQQAETYIERNAKKKEKEVRDEELRRLASLND